MIKSIKSILISLNKYKNPSEIILLKTLLLKEIFKNLKKFIKLTSNKSFKNLTLLNMKLKTINKTFLIWMLKLKNILILF